LPLLRRPVLAQDGDSGHWERHRTATVPRLRRLKRKPAALGLFERLLDPQRGTVS